MTGKHGKIAEEYFSKMLYSHGLNYTFVDDWYDYEVEGIKVELKSCQMTVIGKYCKGDNTYDGFRIGRFDFTSEENRKLLKENKVWVALIVRHRNQCIFYGFVKPEQLNGERYISIHKARELKPICFNDWIDLNKLKTKNRPCPYCGREIIID